MNIQLPTLKKLWRKETGVVLAVLGVGYLIFAQQNGFRPGDMYDLPGPIVARGPQAPPITRVNLVNNSGRPDPFALLPPEATLNSRERPPFTCYVGARLQSGSITWFAVGDEHMASKDAPECAMELTPQNRWRASMKNVPTGWSAVWIVVY